jgi:hypothetical protein
VEALRSMYERLELRVWSLLPERTRRRLTTYGIADLLETPPLRREAATRQGRTVGPRR